jgi:hypothetical protein
VGAANTPSGDPASVFSPDFVTTLGRYLSFGTIGVGLALAVCAMLESGQVIGKLLLKP